MSVAGCGVRDIFQPLPSTCSLERSVAEGERKNQIALPLFVRIE